MGKLYPLVRACNYIFFNRPGPVRGELIICALGSGFQAALPVRPKNSAETTWSASAPAGCFTKARRMKRGERSDKLNAENFRWGSYFCVCAARLARCFIAVLSYPAD